jgi:hypothetical protein
VHPFVESFSWSEILQQLRYGFGELFNFAAIHRFYHCLPGGKVAVQSADTDTGASRDFFQAHVHAGIGEAGFGCVDQQLPVTGAVDTGLARFGGGLALRVD